MSKRLLVWVLTLSMILSEFLSTGITVSASGTERVAENIQILETVTDIENGGEEAVSENVMNVVSENIVEETVSENGEEDVVFNNNTEGTFSGDDISNFSYSISNEKVTISAYNGTDERVIVPSTIEGYPVVSIGKKAFAGCTTMYEITLPESITGIYAQAFAGCSQLGKINWNCRSLGTFYSNAFEGCDSVKTIYYGPNVVTAYKSADTGSLFGQGVEEYVVDAENTTFVAIDGVLYKRDTTDNSKLVLYHYPVARQDATFTMDAATISVLGGSFINVKYLKTLVFSESVTTFSSNTISGCEALEHIDFGGVTTMNDVRNCAALKAITIRQGISGIYLDTFSGCNALEKVVLGKDVTTITYNPFFGLNIQQFEVEEGNNIFYTIDGVLFKKEGDLTYLVAYPPAKEGTSYETPNEVTHIGKYAFYTNAYLEDIKMSENVTDIGEYAFAYTSRLENVDLAACVNYEIQGYAFWHNDAIESVVFGIGLSKIGSRAFGFSGSLESITITGNGSCVLGEYAFISCGTLKEVIIGAGISDCNIVNVFYNSTVESLYLGKDVSAIRYSFISECPNFSRIECDEQNEHFSAVDGVLYDKTGTKLILLPNNYSKKIYVLPDAVQEIEPYAMGYLNFVEQVVLHDNIDTISNCCFYDAGSLKEVVIGKNVKSIGNYAFYGCENLKYVVIPTGCTTIGNRAFDYAGLISITIPEGVETIGESAIPNCTILGVKGSAAETYAIEKGYCFIELNPEETDDLYYQNTGETSYWDGESVEKVDPIGNKYVITSAAQLVWVAEQVNNGNTTFEGKTIILISDIDLEGKEWTPIGSAYGAVFRGNFDGQDNTISNFVIPSGVGVGGLFGRVQARGAGQTTYIKDLTVSGVTYTSTVAENVGGVVGYVSVATGASLVIDNCTVKGTLSGKRIGGVVGYVYGGVNDSEITINNCHVTALISASASSIYDTEPYAGGIVGNLYFADGDGNINITGNIYSGKATGTGYYGKPSGVIAQLTMNGSGKLLISRCQVKGTISPGRYVSSSGILLETPSNVLNKERIHIFQCINYASVAGYYAGGIVGNVNGAATIEQCANLGTISGKQTAPSYGGIVGRLGSKGYIKDCFNKGTISSNNFAYNGGIAGINYGIVENSYNLGELPGSKLTSTGVSAPGSVTSQNHGIIKYCYYDYQVSREVLVGTESVQHIVGEVEDDARIHSGGLSTLEMKSASSLTNWDFANVWTLNTMYNGGYPVLTGLLDILPTDPELETEMVIVNYSDYTIKVIDQWGNPVEGATVQLEGEEPLTTNRAGKITLVYDQSTITGTVSKENYVSYSFSHVMKPEGYDIFRIVDMSTMGLCDLISVGLEYNDNTYELLTENKVININFKDTEFDIVCEKANPNAEITNYAIIQGEEVIKNSSTGEFHLKVGDFKSEEDVYIRVTEAGGESSDTLINLDVTSEVDLDPAEIQIGNGFSFSVDEDVPFLGGKDITFSPFKLPVSLTVDQDKYKVAINIVEVSSGFNRDAFDKTKNGMAEVEAKAFESKTTQDLLDSLEKYMATGKYKISESPEVALRLIGYAEGPITGDTVKGTIIVEMEVEFSGEGQVNIFVFGYEVTGKIGIDGSVDWDIMEKELDGNLTMFGELGFEVSAGVGAAYVASVYVYGGAKTAIRYVMLPPSISGLSEWTIEGEVGLGARLFGSEIVEVPLTDGDPVYVYRRDTSTERSTADAASFISYEPKVNLMEYIYDSTNYSMIKRGTYSVAWTGDQGSDSLISDGYDDMRPQIMRCGTDVVMVFLNDGGDSRSEADKSTLMYSVYNSGTMSWSEPVAVWDDGTADFNPDAYSDGTSGYVVWNNANSSLSSEDSVDTISSKTEVSVAKYDATTQSFVECNTITSNSDFEMQPQVYVMNGSPKVSWLDNSDNNLFGATGTNDLYRADCDTDGNWSSSKVVSLESPLLGGSLGELENKLSYTYIWDRDGNLLNTTDQIGYVVSMEDGTKTSLSETTIESAILSKVDGETAVIWQEGGNIYYKSTLTAAAQNAYETPRISGNIVNAFANGTQTSLVYTENIGGCSNAYLIQKNSDGWSEPIAVTAQDGYVEAVEGVYLGDSRIFVYNRRIVDMEADTNVNNLQWMQLDRCSGIQIEELECKQETLTPGQIVSVMATVTNTGTTAIGQLTAEISTSAGEVVETVLLNADLLAGEEDKLEIQFTLPVQAIKDTYSVKLYVADDDSFLADAGSIELGSADLSLKTKLYQVGGQSSVVATVTNSGFEPVSGTIIFYDYEDEEVIFDQYTFSDLAYNQRCNYTWKELTENLPQKEHVIVGVKVETDADLRYGVCNEDTAIIFRDVEYPAKGVSVTPNQAEVYVESTLQLEATVLPSNATVKVVSWESSDEAIATVSEEGLVTAITPGIVKIYAVTQDGGLRSKATITVKDRIYVVTFDSQGGTSVDPIEGIKEGNTISLPESPKKEGYIFKGWFTEVNGKGEEFTADRIIMSDITVYAYWVKKEQEPGELDPDVTYPNGIWATEVEEQIYTGTALTPQIYVYDGTVILKKNRDYTITYKNNKKAYMYTAEDYATYEKNLKETGKSAKYGTFDPKKAPQIIIKMKGNYSGSKTVYFCITQQDISSSQFSIENLVVTYSGKKQTPKPILVWNGKKLKYGTDFYVSEYDDAKKDKSAFTAPGNYSLTVMGKNNFAGQIPISLIISQCTNQIAFSKVTVKGINNLPWTGVSLKQNNYVVKYKKDVLEEGVDYTISWGENVDVGMGTITFQGTGTDADGDGYSYIGTKTVSFKIIGTSISKVNVTGIDKIYPYTGTSITPEAVLTYKADKNSEPKILIEGIHYTVSYQKNLDKGTATIIYRGLETGGYVGTKKQTFKIVSSQLTEKEIDVAFKCIGNMQNGVYVAPYMKGGAKPEVVVSSGSKILEFGKDYTISYANNKKSALSTDRKAPTVIVKGKGNYGGTVKLYFSIVTKALTNENGISIVAQDKVANSKKNGYRQGFKVYDADGKVLGSSDYDKQRVTYTLIQTVNADGVVVAVNEELDKNSIVPANSVIQITVHGKGNYEGGSAVGTYRIVEDGYDVKKATIQINTQIYTGSPITITEQSQFKTGKVYVKVGKETKVLVLGRDIEIVPDSYVNNVNKGTAKVTIRGINDYGGQKTVQFKIQTRSVADFWEGLYNKFIGRSIGMDKVNEYEDFISANKIE